MILISTILALKGTQFKWLDLYQVCQDLAPTHQVNRIRYFTARVKPRPNDPQQATRQAIYLRALETISVLTIHYGHFRDRKKFRRLVTPIPGYPHTVEVWNTEEKGTDVNLASYLLLDGFQNEYEQAFVISNDSDLALPIEKTRDQLKLPIGIVNPNPNPKGITRMISLVRQLL